MGMGGYNIDFLSELVGWFSSLFLLTDSNPICIVPDIYKIHV